MHTKPVLAGWNDEHLVRDTCVERLRGTMGSLEFNIALSIQLLE